VSIDKAGFFTLAEIVIWYIDSSERNKSERFSNNSTEFDLFRKGIVSIDFSQFIQHPQTKKIDLARNKIEEIDLAPIGKCSNLQTLYISFNNLKEIDLNPLHYCKNLVGLSVRKNKISLLDISPLFYCSNLHELKFDPFVKLIADEKLKDLEIKPVAIVEKLERIQWKPNLLNADLLAKFDEILKNKPTTPINIVALEYITSRGTKMVPWVRTQDRELDLFRKGISQINLTPLSLCKNLTKIDLARNHLTELDLNPLSECGRLEILYISFNKLKTIDLKPLQSCSSLQELSIRKNPITSVDISPLFSCSNLRELKVEETCRVVADSKLKSNGKMPLVISNLFGRIHWTDGLHSDEYITQIHQALTIEKEAVHKPASKPTPTKETPTDGAVNLLRGCEVVGGKFEYKAKIQNSSPYVITNVTVTIVAYPRDCMQLEGANMKEISRIEPTGFRSPQFTFLPTKDCVEGQILASVSYVDYQNNLQTDQIEPYTIRSVCDLLIPLESTIEKFETMIGNLSCTSEEHTLDWNSQVLFEKTKVLLPTKNFHIIEASGRPIGGHFTGTVRGFAQGKYTSNKVALQILINGPIDGNESTVVIEGLSNDTAMLPTTLDEIAHGIESWMCINCGAALSTEEVALIKNNQPISCQYCKRTITIDLYRR
jgi:Leucine-rich repeat (LRR) protein/DNA-directed RNA polymerase subunit RPC12/RpoP